MSISLYDISVINFQQILSAVSGYLSKGREHCEENDIDLDDVVKTRLYPDMLPFSFQLISVAHHSLGAIQGVEAGVFSPPPRLELEYEELQNHVVEAQAGLQQYSRESVNALVGKDIEFRRGELSIPFKAEDFLMSFSLPNFYFHATTAYDYPAYEGCPSGQDGFLGTVAHQQVNNTGLPAG